MSDIRHSNSLEIERRTKVLLSQSTDVLKERLSKGFILVVSSVSSVLDNFYFHTSKQVANIYYSKKGFIDIKPNQLHLCSILSKQKSLAKIELKNEWIAIVLDYSCPYLGRKYKSEIKKALADIISFDKNAFSIIFEEKDSLVNMYYWIRLTYSPDRTNGDNLWVKSKTLDFKNDKLFCSEIQQQIHSTFGYTIDKNEVKDNLDEIMELFRMKNY